MLNRLLNNEITQDEYLYLRNARIVFKATPNNIEGLIKRKYDTNIIIINNELPYEQQKEALLHEFIHLELNHLDSNSKRSEKEIETDDYLKELLN